MDAEIALLLRGHGILDFVDDEPAGEGQEQIEVIIGGDIDNPWQTLYPEIGYGEQVLAILGDWLDGHMEFQNDYMIRLWQFLPPDLIATNTHVRAPKGYFTA